MMKSTPQAHQIGIDAENKHHGKGEKQRQRYHGGYYQRRAQIANNSKYDQKNDGAAKNQIFKTVVVVLPISSSVPG